MIDIDIVEQLIPNPLTMLVQLCSTLVLFLLMRKFLWASVKDFMARRADHMQEDLTAQETARAEAESDREAARSELQAAGARSEEIVSAAVKEAGSQKEQILAEANREADLVRRKAQEQIEADRRAMYADMQKEMIEVAMSAAGKLISTKDGEELDREAVDAFVKEAVKE